MLETKGNLWDFHAAGHWVCITTNGFVKNNGEAVMGAGCAKEAKQKYPNIPKLLGTALRIHGNHVMALAARRILTFPVKHNWWEGADPRLIEQSAHELMAKLNSQPGPYPPVYLPRPGCGNGKLRWEDVKPILAPILDDRVVIVTF